MSGMCDSARRTGRKVTKVRLACAIYSHVRLVFFYNIAFLILLPLGRVALFAA